jgi:CMP-N,N'-diacetyllegionaminic acid synthase
MQNKIKKSVLIIGYGSIGERHAKVLSKLNFIKSITILSKRLDHKFKKITSLNSNKINKYDYIIVSNSTSDHYTTLKKLNSLVQKKIILIEKPLFEKYRPSIELKNRVYVGYNMRFNPIIKFLKKQNYKKKPLKITIISKSNLKNWRYNAKYSKSESAKKDSGGVLLDYSHELDFITWIFGEINLKFSIYKKISNLNIQSNDFLTFVGTIKKTILLCEFNYFSKIPSREINIDYNNKSFKIDLLKKEIVINEKNKTKKIKFKLFKRDHIYRQMHTSILLNNGKYACKFSEGLKLMKTLEQIKSKK